MMSAAEHRSGKGHRDENFPVASWLIAPKHRPAILAFYNFVRTADDIADHTSLSETGKLAHLDQLERSLLGDSDAERVGVALRDALATHNLAPRHAQDLLVAFRRDVTQRRYADWNELIDYCRHSAMPVGRFVLDVHGEDRGVWPANDALCAALQIINHLQDCRKDYLDLDRVYVPLDALAAAGASVETLGAERANPELLDCLHGLAERTAGLLAESRVFSGQITDTRLALEVAVIQGAAERLTALLAQRDPLCDRVHLGKPEAAATVLSALIKGFSTRLFRIGPKLRSSPPS